MVFCRYFVFYSVQVSLIICTLKQNLKTKHSNVQWNVFKGVYFYWEKSTPQFECAMECLQRSAFSWEKSTPPFKIELISGEYFFPCGSNFFPGKYCSGSTFFPGNYYSGSNFFRGVIIYGYTGSAPFVYFREEFEKPAVIFRIKAISKCKFSTYLGLKCLIQVFLRGNFKKLLSCLKSPL